MAPRFKPELLSPAGSLDKLKASITYGADAVYLAGQKYGLRSAAENFTLDELDEGVQFAKAHGAKIYVVLNSFPHDQDIESLGEFVGQISDLQVNGVIASDLGVISIVRKNSQLPVHLSTQASCLNSESGKIWKKQGVSRLILGREVSIQDAGKIKRATGLEVELFIHGSMCMAYSGNCTISNFTRGRDSNRGGCAQSCRLSYTLESPSGTTPAVQEPGTFFMSSKDLLGLDLLEYFSEEQIDSVKIEGRMRSPLYAATTAKVYREAIDAYDRDGKLSPQDLAIWLKQLDQISHRDYMSGSLVQPANENSTVTYDTKGNQEFEFVGTVRRVEPEKGYVLMDVRTSFRVGETLDLLPFEGDSTLIPVQSLMSSIGQSIDHARVSTLVRLPYFKQAQVGCILRKAAQA